MKRFGLGFLIGILFCALFAFIVVYAAMHYGERKVSVPSSATLVLHLEGDLPEQAPVEYPIPFLEQRQPMTVLDTWQMLRKAAVDARIKAIVLEPRGLDVGWAKLQELHDDVVAFKKSGKPVYAFLRGAGAREYYVASAADHVYMTEEDELDLKGIAAELLFVKGTLDKVGVDMEFEHVGKYKDAPDMFTRTTPTPETLEVTNSILDQYFGNLVDTIAQSRNKKSQDIRALIDNGPFLGNEALHGGLVDGLLFEDEVFAKVKDQIKTDINKIGEQDYVHAPVAGTDSGNKIAFLVGEGDITRGATYDDATDSGITATGMVKLMRQVENDSSIKGVIFRIDSPGGDGIASDDILHEAKILAQKKPMIISMSDLAASGGYFIAVNGDPIVAYPNTLTGSIGVFFGKPDAKALATKIGVTEMTLKRGQFADIDGILHPLTDPERAKLRTEIETFYHDFVTRVAAGRKKSYDQIEPLAQGRVWLGVQAKQNGLVDDLGGIDRAVEMIKEKAKIPASEKVTLVTYPPRRTIFDLLMNRQQDQSAEAMIRQRVQVLAPHMPVRALLHGGILALMPYSLQIK
jgi:protease-4